MNLIKLLRLYHLKRSLFLVFLATFLLRYPAGAQVSVDTAVDFSVKDVNSLTHHLFNYLDDGKIVVLDFFTTNCGPCQTYASQVSQAYEYFGCNEGNVIFLGINWGSNNDDVRIFDSLWGAHYPSVSGLQGGGNSVVDDYQVQSYPTVAIITPDHLIANHLIWPPEYDSIVQKVLALGGIPSQCTVSVIDILTEKSIVKVLPNGELYVNTNTVEGKEVVLNFYSMSGASLFEMKLPVNTEKRIVLPLHKGLYIGTVKVEHKLTGSIKVIIP